MCGINGIFAFNPAAGRPEMAELLATREAMANRGPDGAGAWRTEDGRVALAQRRLAIIDLHDRAQQPMLSADGRLAIVYNGEIYNHPELRRELESVGVQYRTTSDTETLLHLYDRYGEAMVHKLRGMFAFAIWDERRKGLLLARDPYGIKPLYTANDGWTFRFASQVKALLAGGKISRDPEPAGLTGFHLFGHVPEPFTLYRDIRALPAGHIQWIDGGGARLPVRYVDLGAILAEGARRPAPVGEVHDRVRAAVRESVRFHMLADVEVGAFLSAGVDSGALVGLMADAGEVNIRAITLGFEEFRGTPADEAPLASQVARAYGARHVVRRVSEQEFHDDLPAILAAMDQPSIDGVNTWFVAKAAKEAGLKVAISGLGGDELLAGYPSFADVPRWRRVFGPLAHIPGAGLAARAILPTLIPGVVRRQPKVLGVLEHAGTWAGAYMLRRGLFLPHELDGRMDPNLVREGLRRLRPTANLGDALTTDPGGDMGRVCALESSNYMKNQLLRDADWAGMAHSVEIRTPLVDIQLLKDLAPVIATLRAGVGKAALAAAPSRPLPPEVASRAKTGFGVPTANWMAGAASFDDRTVSNGLASRRWSNIVLAGAEALAA